MARPTPTPNPSYQPSFTQSQGTVRVGGNTPPTGTIVHARVVSTTYGDVWASTASKLTGELKANGDYFLSVSVNAGDLYAGATVEFYISGVKANQTSSFLKGDYVGLNLTFP